MNLGFESSNIGHSLGVKEFMYKFGYEISPGKWVIRAQDQQVLSAAAAIGLGSATVVTGFLSDFFGRRKVIVLGCLTCFAGIFTQYYARSIMMLFAGKMISSLGYGLGHSLVLYSLPRRASPISRRLSETIVQCFGCIFLPIKNKRYGLENSYAYSSNLSSILLLAGVPFLPESPSWLIFHDGIDEAARSLRAFNGKDYDTDNAIAIVYAALEEEKKLKASNSKANWIETVQGTNFRRTLLSCMGFACQQLVGASFMSGYMSYYFVLAGVHNPFGISQMVYSVQLLGNMCAWPLVERVGRRRILLCGMVFMKATLVVIGGVSTVHGQTALKIVVSFLWSVYQMTAGSIVFAIAGETPTPRLRQKTFALNVMTVNLLSTTVVLVLPYLMNTDKANLGGKTAFVFFGPSVPCCIYLYFCLPEMKGRNVAELEEMYQKQLPARKFGGYQCDVTSMEGVATVIKEPEV
ncbi:general substrate transporter [Lipomyces starkeyi]